MDELEVLRRAIERYGAKSQINMAIEEMSELTKELCKHLRGRENRNHISEEIADVAIMLQQLVTIFDCEKDVERWGDKKIGRLATRLEKEG